MIFDLLTSSYDSLFYTVYVHSTCIQTVPHQGFISGYGSVLKLASVILQLPKNAQGHTLQSLKKTQQTKQTRKTKQKAQWLREQAETSAPLSLPFICSKTLAAGVVMVMQV